MNFRWKFNLLPEEQAKTISEVLPLNSPEAFKFAKGYGEMTAEIEINRSEPPKPTHIKIGAVGPDLTEVFKDDNQ